MNEFMSIRVREGMSEQIDRASEKQKKRSDSTGSRF